MICELKAPFPWFGGKSRVAGIVWQRFGSVANLVDPFCGSLAILLGAPADEGRIETVNDKDGFVANFWRAVAADPEQVAHWADWLVNENDLHARHIWLVNQTADLVSRLEGNPDYYDAKIAGWWVWGICAWIGSGWCSGVGPWQSVDGLMTNVGSGGVNRQRPHLGDAGQGVNRKRPHLGNAGQGVNRQLPHLGPPGRGVNKGGIYDWFESLAARLRRVRVCCGDWTRVLGPSPTTKQGLTAVFLDPPYDQDERDDGLYIHEDRVSGAVREWAIAHGDDPLLRIALCGYEKEHVMPDSWECYAWSSHGYNQSAGQTGRGETNRHRERIWFSPHCLKPQGMLALREVEAPTSSEGRARWFAEQLKGGTCDL